VAHVFIVIVFLSFSRFQKGPWNCLKLQNC